MEENKCFCHFQGYEVKDAKARKSIEDINTELENVNTEIESLSTGNTSLSETINSLSQNKQDKLTAGDNIIITNNVISSTGGSGEGSKGFYFKKVSFVGCVQDLDYLAIGTGFPYINTLQGSILTTLTELINKIEEDQVEQPLIKLENIDTEIEVYPPSGVATIINNPLPRQFLLFKCLKEVSEDGITHYTFEGTCNVQGFEFTSETDLSTSQTLCRLTVSKDSTGVIGANIELMDITHLDINNEKVYTPTKDYAPATKKYVDEARSNIFNLRRYSWAMSGAYSVRNIIYDMKDEFLPILNECITAGIKSPIFIVHGNLNSFVIFKYSAHSTIPEQDTHTFVVLGGSNSEGTITYRGTFEAKWVYTDGLISNINSSLNNFKVYQYKIPTIDKYNAILFKDNETEFTPTADYHPATKKYVDDMISPVSGGSGESLDLSNYLAKDNTTEFTPTENYNPATKKYVDDKLLSGTTEPTSDTGNDGDIYIMYEV